MGNTSLPLLASKEDVLLLKTDIRKATTSISKWMFFFWITQVIMTFGLFYFFLNK
jgi:hypothetical protein